MQRADPAEGLRVEFFVALRFDNISAYKFKLLVGQGEWGVSW